MKSQRGEQKAALWNLLRELFFIKCFCRYIQFYQKNSLQPNVLYLFFENKNCREIS